MNFRRADGCCGPFVQINISWLEERTQDKLRLWCQWNRPGCLDAPAFSLSSADPLSRCLTPRGALHRAHAVR
jgi:hypothetical protein